MTIENLILNGQVHTLLYVNKLMSKTLLSVMKLFASQYDETV